MHAIWGDIKFEQIFFFKYVPKHCLSKQIINNLKATLKKSKTKDQIFNKHFDSRDHIPCFLKLKIQQKLRIGDLILFFNTSN